jgi:Fibronectin type-III domain
LVMDETTQHYIDANPNIGGDPKTLNIPSLRNMDCSPNCTWTRTVRNTRNVATSWTASGTAITPGFDIEVSPSSFTFGGGLGETQELTITATPTTDLTSAVAFGEVALHETGGVSPDELMTVAIKGLPGGGGDITLTANVHHKEGKTRVELAWSPADGGEVAVLRNGSVVHTTVDDGIATNNAGTRTGTVTYQVCETDSGDCSNVVEVMLR